jgi:xylan 1,4-beta-xylosidase
MAGNTTTGFGAAIAAASSADATVIVVGLDTTQEAEGLDRYIIALPGVQSQLIAAVAAAAKGPVIVVVMAGGAVDLSQVVANSKVDAILWVGYPGQSGGQALAEIVFGDAVPSGRTVYSFYNSSFIAQVCSAWLGVME